MSALTDFTLSSAKSLADVDHLVTGISVNWAAGTVAELTIELVDPAGALSSHGLLELGGALTWRGTPWQIGSVDRNLGTGRTTVTVAARSRLAKQLRLTSKPGATKNISPANWITKKVKAAGGKATCQAGARRRTIVQKKGQSVLDVINTLAQATETQWVEADGLFVCGTPWWAYQGGPGLPTWSVTWGKAPETDAISIQSTVSEDDKTQGASASVTLPFSVGAPIRPWHQVKLSGAGAPLDGLWLVGDLTLDLMAQGPVSLALSRPLKSSPKNGSSKSTAGTSSSTSSGSKTESPVTISPGSNESGTKAGTRSPAGSMSGVSSTNGGTALDYPMPVGTPVYACRSGVVISCRDGVPNHASGGPASRWPAAANYVLLGVTYAGKPARVLYWHMSPGLNVSAGQKVDVGHLLGRSGNTGHSTGPHLHIQAAWGHQDSPFGGPIIFPPSQVWS